MKYKDKFLELQATVLDRYNKIQEEFHEVNSILSSIQYSLEDRKKELSPELYEYLNKKLNDAAYRCSFNSLVKREYYGS